ncbi:Smad-related protein daf-14 [Caenorhabditis elegans]|nr:Smad-related protein daf-14 [Caenorhabditis elegans]AAF03892.1 Smad protein [Caenorhabditis elegans]CAB02890.3 Smad-related protein daf-14 [Caenorhabditis elegans]|eukprot:NP_001255476.1 Uncharacterized protein CELE_F01G10.8 [Caenorhabditis elegans]
MYPDQVHLPASINNPNMPINDWLEDAPMPDCYNVPSTSTDENNDPFPFSNISSQSSLKPKTPEKAVVEVRPTGNEMLDPEPKYPKEEKPWCTIFYYELTVRLGKAFEAKVPTITIDGATGASDECRMSLTSQPSSRNSKSSQIRNTVGAGIQLAYENGELWLTVLTDQIVFVQCPFLNQTLNKPLKYVFRLQNKGDQKRMKIFDKEQFEQEKTLALGPLTEKEVADERMRIFSNIRVSFCKGFGETYSRLKVVNLPCWIEIILHEPADEYDTVFRINNERPEIGSRS